MVILRALLAANLAILVLGQGGILDHGGVRGNLAHDADDLDMNSRRAGSRDGLQPQKKLVPPHQNQPQIQNQPDRFQNQPVDVRKIPKLQAQPPLDGLATSVECAEDVHRICGDKARLTNLEILSCMTERIQNDDDLSQACHIYLWNYKLNVTSDPKFTRIAREVCKKPLEQLNECQQNDDSNGKMIPCLIDHKSQIEYRPCYHFLLKMATIIFSDYHFVCDFVSDCKVDIERYHCGRVNKKDDEAAGKDAGKTHSQGAVINCLESEIVEGRDVDEKCAKQIIRLSELSSDDFHLDRNLYFACKEDRERLCEEVAAGEGRIYKCLFQHKFDPEMSSVCRSALTTRQRLVAQDYKASYALQMFCQRDIEALRCRDHPEYRTQGVNDHGDFVGVSGMLLCIEEAKLTRQYVPNSQCTEQLAEFRRLLSEDYKMSPEIVNGCQNEISAHCGEEGIAKNGGTIHCLMALAQKDVKNGKRYELSLSDQCMKAMIHLLKEDHAISDYRMDRALAEACNPVVETACASHEPGDPLVLSCLMEHIHTNMMVEPCRKRLMELQFFVSRDFTLDEKFYSKCRKDVKKICGKDLSEMGQDEAKLPFSMVISCLYRHIPDVPREKRDGKHTSAPCTEEVRQAMKYRALEFHLNPDLESACIHSLGKYCSSVEIEKGFELVCLQDHFENITDDADNRGDQEASDCIDRLEEITEIEEAEEGNLDNALLRACEPDVNRFCTDEQENGEEGEVMECLIERKLELSKDCQAGVTHLQLIELKDVKFSYNFMKACKQDIADNCQDGMTKGPTRKNEIIECLSTTHLESQLLKKASPVSDDCVAQLTIENFQRHDDNLKLNPELRKACQPDLKKHCKASKVKGLECLRLHHHEISPKCRKELFKLEKQEAIDPRLDVSLMRTCKSSIMKHCSNYRENSEAVLGCLIGNKDTLGDKCFEVVREREREQFSDINLNPELLDACGTDVQHNCRDILTDVNSRDTEEEMNDMHGEVINCLKKVASDQHAKHPLSKTCTKHIRFIIKEEQSDYKLDPLLTLNCIDIINTLCKPDTVASVVECLKVNYFQEHLSRDPKCMLQVARLLQEGRSDIMADPVLHSLCQLDIQHHCSNVAEGKGRIMACILDAVRTGSKPVTVECRDGVLQRQDMWNYAKKKNLETFSGIADAIWTSPSHSYFLSLITMIFLTILILGVFCGRMTKRISRQRKMV